MKQFNAMIALSLLVFAGSAAAGSNNQGHKGHDYSPRQDLFEYARVVDVSPIVRQVRVSNPVRECWDQPVYHTENQPPKSAGGMLVGGLIGGIIGHQFGNGRGRRVATAVGTLIGAKVGHDAVNGHRDYAQSKQIIGYDEVCNTRHQVSYEEVVDSYDVTYRYRARHYHIVMPYDPGKRIKMRIQFTPVI